MYLDHGWRSSLVDNGRNLLTIESTVEILCLIHACSYAWKAAQTLRTFEPVKNQALDAGVIEIAVADRMEGIDMRGVIGGAQSMLNLC